MSRSFFRSSFQSLVLVLAFGSVGCDCNSVAPSPGIDSSIPVDANTPTDANVATDADVDATVADADVDATVADADVDATVTDAGADATVTDAGTDATVTDAGTDMGVDAGPPVPSCKGTPTACNTLSGFLCQNQGGCTQGTFSSCTGTPDACSTYTSQFACLLQSNLIGGCAWTGAGPNAACTGTPSACSTRNANTCTQGCVAVGACTGTATACTTFTAQGQCILQQGCAWQ